MLTHTHVLRLLTGAALTATAGCETVRLAPGDAGPVPLDPARDLASMRNPSTDVLSVAAWSLALVVAALVIAFVARLLNGRNRGPATSAQLKESS